MKKEQRPQYEPLDEEDYQLYKFLIDYIKSNGYPPTVREIGKELGCPSSMVQPKLYRLEVRGKLKVTPGMSRAIKLLEYDFVRKAYGK